VPIPLGQLHWPEPTGALGLWLLLSYLLGAVPFGFVLAKGLRGVDLRTVGSGNIGATNAMRVLGKPWGVVAFLLDFAKGLVPAAVFAPWASADPRSASLVAVACGAAAVLGHVFPVYLRFRGGKAVATGCGAIAGIDWVVFAVAGAVWPLALLASRRVSVASLALGTALPVVAALRAEGQGHGPEVVLACVALWLLIVVRHRSNIARLLAGTEPRIGQPKQHQSHG
jgi:glycerol-3-phosphate acyltransferase PlsY